MYELAKAGHLIGEEGFSFDNNGKNHQFTCRCVSSEAKVIAIRRSDVYRLCVVLKWFAEMFFARCQTKSEWLFNRF